ncbi:MAG: LytTR family transcriptional regulator DNA-binding domain-containing protein, partial [Flavobacteriales bacterium]|nr:LytTR family transcriptional regulator DNA-binding domain-containing protein [Flavobacteriales bacterium]
SMFSTIDGVYIKVGDSLVCKIEKNKKPLNFGMLDDENFWVAYESGGFAIYDFEGKLQKRYLQKVSGTFMCRDNFNGLWFSTLSRGVFYTANLDLINISALEGKSVYKLGLSENEDLYVSLYNKSLVKIKKGGGLNIHTKSGTSLLMPFSYYDVEANLELFDNSAFYMKDKRFVLRGGLSFNANTGKWFLQEEVFPHQKGKYLNSIAKSSNAYIVGTQSGAYRLSVNGELLKVKEGKLKGRINDVKVINIFELYSTHGSGIQIYKDQKYFQEITTSTGLPSNLINQLVVKNDSSIYVCSKKGLSEIILKEGRWTFLSNHLLNYDVSDAEFVGDSVWIGTNDGLLKMPVSDKGNQLEKVNLFLQLKEIRVNGQLTSIDELLHLETDQNNLKLNYDAIYYSDHNKLQFRYKLSTEENWSYTKNRSLLYNYIEPGDYTLSIQVSIDDTHWDEEVLLNFSIRLPYYATLIFLVIMLFIIAVFIYLIFKFRIILYNKVLVNSLAKLLVRKLSQSEKYIVIREQGKDIKIFSHQILFVRSSGNYCEIHIDDKKYLTRAKISNFYDQLPDQNNYLKIHRSYFVRIDKIIGKTKNSIMIKDVELKVSNSFLLNLRKVKL